MRVNCVESAMGMVMTWASTCLLISFRSGQADRAAFAFWAAAPFAFFTGYQLINVRRGWLRTSTDITSPFILELKIRQLLEDEGKTPDAFAKADAMFEKALTTLTASSMAHIYYALYLQKYRKNRHMEMAQLALAERKVRRACTPAVVPQCGSVTWTLGSLAKSTLQQKLLLFNW